MKSRRRNSSVDEGASAPEVHLEPRGESQAALVEAISQRVPYCICTGPAGTGKTFVSATVGLRMVLSGDFHKMVVARPIVDVKGASIGYLQGSLDKKLQPYLQPVIEIIQDAVGKAAYQKMLAAGAIEYVHVGHMRGRTFSNAFVLIDEAQNATSDSLRMIMSRLGEGSVMAICGDPKQPDLPLNGLDDLVERVSSADFPSFRAIRMTGADVQRSQAIRDLAALYGAGAGRSAP